MYRNFDLIRIAPPGILSRNDVILITSSASSVLPRCFFFVFTSLFLVCAIYQRV